MKAGFGAVVVAAALTFGVTPASAYSTLYAFGDSLSDAGNIFNLSGYPAPPYYNGHFSNGLTWVEDLSLKLGLGTLTPSSKGGNDWAYGGAQTGPQIPGITPALVSLDAEVAGYLGLHHTADPNALYTLSIGGNDIFQAFDALHAGRIGPGDLPTVVETAVANTISEVSTLANAGMKTLVFYELPDVSLTPLFNTQSTLVKDAAQQMSAAFDLGVLDGLAPLENLMKLKVYDLPIYAQTDAIVQDPALYGFDNVTDACWTGGFTGPKPGEKPCAPTVAGQDKYLFWDFVHPTEHGHLLTANLAYDMIIGSPEPSTWAMMLLGFSALGFAGWRASRKSVAVAA
jgi:phospholipase/lecithinase/hemolysin